MVTLPQIGRTVHHLVRGGSYQARSLYYSGADSWIITEGITLQKDYTYYVKIKKPDNLEILKVYVGAAQTSASLISGTLMHTWNEDPSCASRQTSDIDFVPTSTGTYYFGFRRHGGSGTVEIDNIEIYETPPACSYPSAQASNVSVTNVDSDGATISWDRGTGGDNVLVIARANSATNAEPVDAAPYTASSSFNDGVGSEIGTGNYVVFNGNGTSVTIDNLDHSTQYHFYVYEYKKMQVRVTFDQELLIPERL